MSKKLIFYFLLFVIVLGGDFPLIFSSKGEVDNYNLITKTISIDKDIKGI